MIKFVGSFDTVKSLPQAPFPEYAFIGRSNVGKSSLINAVAGQKVARTSSTPGRTRLLNLFLIRGKVCLADFPGYGYAKISKAEQARWLARLEEYLLSRRQLRLLFILIDSRHELKASDNAVMDFCDANGIPYRAVLTKTDKSGASKIAGIKSEIFSVPRPAACAEILETSAEKKTGVEAIRKIIDAGQ